MLFFYVKFFELEIYAEWSTFSEWPTISFIWSVIGLKRFVGTYEDLRFAVLRETLMKEVLGRTLFELLVSNLDAPRDP